MKDKQKTIPFEEAVLLLPDGKDIHTFRGGGMMLIGADWSRTKLLAAMKRFGVELSGPQATAMKHGLVLKDAAGWLFIETRHGDNTEPGCP